MAGSAAAHKHTDLEDAMAELARAQSRTHAGLQRLEKNIDRIAAEMREGQAETRANLDRLSAEMREGQADTKANLDRYIAENERRFADLAADVKKANRAAGEAVNASGRLVEDAVMPSIPDLFAEFFARPEPPDRMIRTNLHPHNDPKGPAQEFDIVAYDREIFLVCSVKSTARPEEIDKLLDLLPRVRDYFAQADGKRVHGAVASFYIDRSLVTAGESRGLLMLGLQARVIQVLNSPGFRPREF